MPQAPRSTVGARPDRLIRDGEARLPWLVGALLALLALFALHLTASVSAPVAGGLVAALLVAPLDRAVAARVPDALAWLGHVAAVLALLAILAAFAGALAFAGMRAAEEFRTLTGGDGPPAAAMEGPPAPGAAAGGAGLAAPARGVARGAVGGIADAATEAEARAEASAAASGPIRRLVRQLDVNVDALVRDAAQRTSGVVMAAARGAVATASGLVLIVFLALMMLIEGPAWAERAGAAASAERRRAMVGALDALGVRVRRYALLRLAMGVLTAALYGAVLWVMGIDLVWTWAVLTVVLSFVPTIGSIIAGALPTAYALLTRDLGTAAIVGASLLAIEQVIGNFLDPRISGDQVKLSPLVVLVALLVWTWIWGVPGALLAVPATLAMVVLGARIEPLRPLTLMLTDRRDMAGLDEAATV